MWKIYLKLAIITAIVQWGLFILNYLWTDYINPFPLIFAIIFTILIFYCFYKIKN